MTHTSPILTTTMLDVALRKSRSAHRAAGFRSCARVYVVFDGLNLRARSILRKWARENDLLYFGPEGRIPYSLYMGYDNATGTERGKAEAFALHLHDYGIFCGVEEQED